MANLEKEEQLASFTASIKDKSLVFVDYTGAKVDNLEALRGDLRKDGSVIKVFKNTLTKRALSGLSIDYDDRVFTGMVATTIIDDDKFINSSKVLLKAEKEDRLKIKSGLFEGKSIDSDEVRKYASLLSKEEMYGVLVGCLQGIVSNLVFVLDDIKGEKEKNGDKVEAEKVEKAEDKEVQKEAEEEKKEEKKEEAAVEVKKETE